MKALWLQAFAVWKLYAANQPKHLSTKNLYAIKSVRLTLKHPKDIGKTIETLQTENAELKKRIEGLEARQLVGIRNELLQKDEIINQVTFIGDIVEVSNADALKKLAGDVKNHLHDSLIALCANIDGKPYVAISIADTVVAAKNLDAGVSFFFLAFYWRSLRWHL